jgi:type VI secretion system protein ImpK
MTNETLNEQMYWVCADALNLAAQLNTAVDLPTPDVFRQRIDHLFDNMRRSKPPAVALQDVNDAIYALAAFIDEQVLRSPWQGRQQWMARPLQLIYFGEATAGEGFFQRMQALQADPSRSHVLEVYYLCLALGFQGQYAMADKELAAIQADVAQTVARRLPTAEQLSPHGYPTRGLGGGARSQFPAIAISLGALGLAIVLFIALKIASSVSASDAAESIAKPTSSFASSVSEVRG